MRKMLIAVFVATLLGLTGCTGTEKSEDRKSEETITEITTEAEAEDGLYGNMTMVDEEGKVWLDVYDLKSATARVDSETGYIVELVFTDEGSKKLAEATTNLIGKQLRIIVDDQVVSNPTIMSVITDGKAQINGLDTYEQAQNIVTLIKGDKNHPATFDYGTTAEDISVTTEQTEDTAEQVEHREDAIGISEKNISDVDGTFSRNSVKNDVTNSWKVSTIAADISMEEYALSYYNQYNMQENVVEAVINLTRNTSTCMVLQGDHIDVTIYDYVDGEEHDAKQMFTGTLLSEYWVYIDNGDIVQVQ